MPNSKLNVITAETQLVIIIQKRGTISFPKTTKAGGGRSPELAFDSCGIEPAIPVDILAELHNGIVHFFLMSLVDR